MSGRGGKVLTIEAVQLEADGTIKFKVSSVNKIKRVRTGVGDGGCGGKEC